MEQTINLQENPHIRLNILTGEYILVSPHRTKRPWQGKVESGIVQTRPEYDEKCYLCPGNKRADGDVNPQYASCFSFNNDFAALLEDTSNTSLNIDNLLVAKGESGKCRVICFSPRHDLTLPELDIENIKQIIELWKEEFKTLAADKNIRYIQIFENKGEIMGCSNPHPHGQIWAQSDTPVEIMKETKSQQAYFDANNKSLLSAYLELECKLKERIVCENEHFVALVPFWAVWPYETMLLPRRHVGNILQFTPGEVNDFADILKRLTTRYDNLFETSFPYSAGMHQSPVNDGNNHTGWHWHMHFYPPLLRSATVKKFMVGYEMLASPQRDITPETAAEKLRSLSEKHYKSTHI